MTKGLGRKTSITRAMIAISASLSLLAGVAVGAGAVRWYSLRSGSGVDPGPFPGTTASGSPRPAGSCSARPCNYLLLGSDSRSGLSAPQQDQFGNNSVIGGTTRADTIMLVHTDPASKQATVLSFPRDLWVKIPGHGMNKINSAFEGGVEGGGALLMAKTITQLTGLGVDHYLYVDLQGFQDVVNKLEGVDICIPSYDVNTPGVIPAPTATGGDTTAYNGEQGHVVDLFTGLDVLPGCQHLDGTQALAYVRSRHLPCDLIPDFSRIGRQQQFMRAVINQMLQPGQLARAPGLVGPILASMHRDSGFTPSDLVYLTGQLRGLSTGAVEFRSIPGTPIQKTIDGTPVSSVRMDPSAREIFTAVAQNRSIEGVGTSLENTAPSEANTTVLVLDAGDASASTATEDLLSHAGFDVSPGIVSTSPPTGIRHPVVAYRPGASAYAKVVSSYFPGLRQVEVKGLDAPVAIVVFPGYEPPDQSGSGTASGAPAAAGACPNA
jgi:anionic cell wall polymer biosynthesis LytR-Cps2A-Psr (LCP) family protein